MERMGKGLLWNAAPNSRTGCFHADTNCVAASDRAARLPRILAPAWRPAVRQLTPDYEVIGPQVFRFEYYYLLKNGTSSDIPWITPT